MINKTRVRAYAILVRDNVRTIDEVPEEYRIPVYLELLASHRWSLEMVDIRYMKSIQDELGIAELV